MAIEQGNPKTSRAILAVVLGVVLFGMGCMFLSGAITGLKTGQIKTVGRGNSHRPIVQKDNPHAFWIEEAYYFILVIMSLSVAIVAFRVAIRRLRNDAA